MTNPSGLKCYGYDEEFGICLMYGVGCKADKTIVCYHENKEQGMKIFDPDGVTRKEREKI